MKEADGNDWCCRSSGVNSSSWCF